MNNQNDTCQINNLNSRSTTWIPDRQPGYLMPDQQFEYLIGILIC